MPNAYKTNPIFLDTFGSDLDLANLVYGNSNVGVMLMGVRFSNPTLGDKFILKDANSNVVAELFSDASEKDVSSIEFSHHFQCEGLKILATDQKVTTGHVLIYTR